MRAGIYESYEKVLRNQPGVAAFRNPAISYDFVLYVWNEDKRKRSILLKTRTKPGYSDPSNTSCI